MHWLWWWSSVYCNWPYPGLGWVRLNAQPIHGLVEFCWLWLTTSIMILYRYDNVLFGQVMHNTQPVHRLVEICWLQLTISRVWLGLGLTNNQSIVILYRYDNVLFCNISFFNSVRFYNSVLSVGEKLSDTGIIPMIVVWSYIRLWITLILFQPPLSHTSH
jgi:hypothetical protein